MFHLQNSTLNHSCDSIIYDDAIRAVYDISYNRKQSKTMQLRMKVISLPMYILKHVTVFAACDQIAVIMQLRLV